MSAATTLVVTYPVLPGAVEWPLADIKAEAVRSAAVVMQELAVRATSEPAVHVEHGVEPRVTVRVLVEAVCHCARHVGLRAAYLAAGEELTRPPAEQASRDRRPVTVEEIEDFLDLDPWITTRRIAERMGVGVSAVQQCLTRADRRDILERLARNARLEGVAAA